jgi:hypothetical protein
MDAPLRQYEYKAVATLRHIALVDPDRPFVLHHARKAGGRWTLQESAGQDKALDLAAIGVTLPLAEIHRGLSFKAP